MEREIKFKTKSKEMKWQAMKYCKYFILILFDEGLVPGYRKNLCRVVIKKKKNPLTKDQKTSTDTSQKEV